MSAVPGSGTGFPGESRIKGYPHQEAAEMWGRSGILSKKREGGG